MAANQLAAVPNPIPPACTSGERLAFMPRDFDDAWRQAEVLSKIQIFPDYLKGKPHEILATILTGAELGLSPMQSVRDIVVVKGKGFIQSKLKVALVKQALKDGEYFKMVSSSATSAVFETKREGEGITRYEYTIEMAKQADLAGQDNYRKRPAEMLRARCSGDLCEIVWSDVTRGIGTKEDLPETAINSAPTTYAPPVPEMEDAQVVAPTPPPAAKVVEQKTEAQPDSKTVAEEMGKQIDAQAQRLTREPGDDDDAPVQVPVSMQTQKAEPPNDLGIFAEVNAVSVDDPEAEKKLDAISPRARRVEGPVRAEISKLMQEKRRAINAKKTAK